MSSSLPYGWGQAPNTNDARRWAWIVHILYIASFFFGITSIPGVIVAYMKRPEARGTIFESHFTYAIRTFWLSILIFSISAVLCLVLVGYVLLGLAAVWWIVRVVRPVIALMDDRPITNPTGFF